MNQSSVDERITLALSTLRNELVSFIYLLKITTKK